MTKTTKTIQVLDDRDRRILALVQRDAKLPQAEIARRVGLSAAAVNERLKKLESGGVIRRFAALVDFPHLRESRLDMARVALRIE